VAVAFTRDGAFGGEGRHSGQVAIRDIEQTGLEFFALLWTVARVLGVAGDYMARITVQPTPQIFRRLDPVVDAFLPFDESHRVFDFRPVNGPILMEGGLESALGSWLDLVHDAVNQTGFSSALDRDELLLNLQLDD
jgi:hypothetical protein